MGKEKRYSYLLVAHVGKLLLIQSILVACVHRALLLSVSSSALLVARPPALLIGLKCALQLGFSLVANVPAPLPDKEHTVQLPLFLNINLSEIRMRTTYGAKLVNVHSKTCLYTSVCISYWNI